MCRLAFDYCFKLAAFAAMVVAFASCQHGLEEIDEAPVRMERVKLSIAPVQEEVICEPETKTVLASSKILWLPADELAVFSAGDKAVHIFRAGEAVGKACQAVAGGLHQDSALVLVNPGVVYVNDGHRDNGQNV